MCIRDRPFPLNLIAAAAVVTAGIANVNNILKVKVPKEKGISPVAASAPQAPSFNIVGAGTENQLAQVISERERRPLRAYVVGKDITSQQELDRNISRVSGL